MLLYIVRHGQSTGNVSGDDIPDGELTPLGQRQAREIAARLAGEGITHVLCSPLIRALATGTAIAEASGLHLVEVWPELQEHRASPYRGFGRAELLRRFPNAELHHSIEAEGWDHGGETYESALERGRSAVSALRARYTGEERVVVATHGGFANHLLRAILHVPPSSSAWFRQYNCALSVVDFSRPEVELISMNDVSHLTEIS